MYTDVLNTMSITRVPITTGSMPSWRTTSTPFSSRSIRAVSYTHLYIQGAEAACAAGPGRIRCQRRIRPFLSLKHCQYIGYIVLFSCFAVYDDSRSAFLCPLSSFISILPCGVESLSKSEVVPDEIVPCTVAIISFALTSS